jgi:hypothetical protein
MLINMHNNSLYFVILFSLHGNRKSAYSYVLDFSGYCSTAKIAKMNENTAKFNIFTVLNYNCFGFWNSNNIIILTY